MQRRRVVGKFHRVFFVKAYMSKLEYENFQNNFSFTNVSTAGMGVGGKSTMNLNIE